MVSFILFIFCLLVDYHPNTFIIITADLYFFDIFFIIIFFSSCFKLAMKDYCTNTSIFIRAQREITKDLGRVRGEGGEVVIGKL